MPEQPTPCPETTAAWQVLRACLRARSVTLLAPGQAPPGYCLCCRVPVPGARSRCFHCGLHAESAPGELADVVAPVAYAAKGGLRARDLWLYKSGQPGAAGARAALLASLLVFLHDYGAAVWQAARMERPTHACVVPSGRGRAGPHPLRVLADGHVRLPWVGLRAEAGGDPWARLLDPGRFTCPDPLPGAAVLLLDDTWTSGGSAQSASVALKRAGARSVAVVVLGRHLDAQAAARSRGALVWERDLPGAPVADRARPPCPAHQPRTRRAVPGRAL